jgi:DNA-binding transcriptional ArsR family regulator
MTSNEKTQKHAAGVNAELFKALAHPLRGRIMVLLDESQASPKELADRLGESLENVAYHVRGLAKVGLIELIDTDTRRGGKQHFYKASARPIMDTSSWELLPQLLREVNSVWVAQIILGDLIEALGAGTFDARPGRTMLRMHIVVDDEGYDELEPAARRYLEELQAIEARSGERRSKSGERGVNVATAALAFEMPSGS